MKIPGIDKVIVVALHGSTRLAHVLSQLRHLEIEHEVFDAFNGAALRIQTDVTSEFLKGAKLPVGRLANYLSQVAVFREAIRCGYGNVLILEDDVRLSWNFREAAAEAVRVLPADWDLLNFGVWDWKPENSRTVNEVLMQPGWPMLRHAVLHSAKSFSTLVEGTRALRETLDITVSQMVLSGALKAYATRTSIAWQENAPPPPPPAAKAL